MKRRTLNQRHEDDLSNLEGEEITTANMIKVVGKLVGGVATVLGGIAVGGGKSIAENATQADEGTWRHDLLSKSLKDTYEACEEYGKESLDDLFKSDDTRKSKDKTVEDVIDELDPTEFTVKTPDGKVRKAVPKPASEMSTNDLKKSIKEAGDRERARLAGLDEEEAARKAAKKAKKKAKKDAKRQAEQSEIEQLKKQNTELMAKLDKLLEDR